MILTLPHAHVLVQQESSAVNMAFPKPSFLRALSVLLLASALVRCQAPLEPVEEEEPIMETDIAEVATESPPVQCPSDCSCTSEEAVDCAGVDLTEFPSDLSDKISRLSLQVLHTHIGSSRHLHFVVQLRNDCVTCAKLVILSVLCVLISEQQNQAGNSGAHFPSVSAWDPQPSEQLAHYRW